MDTDMAPVFTIKPLVKNDYHCLLEVSENTAAV